MPKPEDLHEWVSFEDPDEARTWLFDVTFLTSSWSCIFGRGCKGVLDHDATDLVQGCCSFGAHFADDDDIAHTAKMAERLTADQWQLRHVGLAQGTTQTNDEGETTTLLVDGACVFLNRPGFDGAGGGCAFHHAAEANGERHLDWMPEVCWQLPIRRIDETDVNGHVTSTVREWKRRDWGEGGDDFHWWCTESDDAFVAADPVYLTLADELRVVTTDVVYELLAAHLDKRRRTQGTKVFLRHPATRG